MIRSPQRFTRNKDTVRTLQRETIERCLAPRLGRLRYFGLPSSALADAIAWQDLFEKFYAVERGVKGKEWELQHDLGLEAFRAGLLGKISLLRGDIDLLIRRKRDEFGNRVPFPFDVVSLDYSGGLFYKNRRGNFTRLQAIAALVAHQGAKRSDFVLLISCNLDQIDQGEVRRTLENVRTELVRYGANGEQVVDAYLGHELEEARLKVYVPHFVNQEAAKNRYSCDTQQVIMYEGNLKTRMMAFRFVLSHDTRTESLRSPRERLSQVFNKPVLGVVGGEPKETTLGLPKLTVPEVPRTG